MGKSYAFNRREVIDTTVWVRADSPEEARRRIDSHGADDASDPKEAQPPTYRRLPAEDFES